MKVIAVLALLAVCKFASADVFKRQMSDVNFNCSDQDVFNFISNLPESCANATVEEFCTDDCAGSLCTYYLNNGYDNLCASERAAVCLIHGGGTAPESCQMCSDRTVLAAFRSLPDSCDISNPANTQAFCNSECAGVVCTFWKDNNYPSDCRVAMGQRCTNANLTVPAECGALALATVKEVTVIVLAVAAFLVF